MRGAPLLLVFLGQFDRRHCAPVLRQSAMLVTGAVFTRSCKPNDA
jgi:hypothetical protein